MKKELFKRTRETPRLKKHVKEEKDRLKTVCEAEGWQGGSRQLQRKSF